VAKLWRANCLAHAGLVGWADWRKVKLRKVGGRQMAGRARAEPEDSVL
jgi:hypothetical protein